ncbi:MAG: helix-turn-helix transcriptional regulator [Lachnospiraceae bacterium]|nr:helix-turn-helix transcriptional regulator [Lachnospiraceae bacterium]
MGRKVSKATNNIYYIARARAAKENNIYASREKAALELGIERSRLTRIELGQVEPYAEEVDIMATAYNAPLLCMEFCDNICPIGIHRLEEQAKYMKPDSIEHLVLRFLSSSQSMNDLSKILVNITQDGMIDKTEIHDLQDVLKVMDSVSENIEAIRFWVMNDPVFRSYFESEN